MTADPIEPTHRHQLQEAVEAYAQSGDFDATWRAATSRRSSPLPALAVAAAAVLALALPVWQLDARAPANSVPTAHWEEPEPLRFAVAPPVPAASAAVRAAHATDDERERAQVWKQAMEATPAEWLPELASRQALVEQARGQIDPAKAAGLQASPPGRLVAAEVALVDLQREEGRALLRELTQHPEVGSTASAYLSLLTRGGVAADLAEVAALGHFAGPAVTCNAGAELLRLASDEVRAEVVALSPVLGRCSDGCQELEVIEGGERTLLRFDAEGRLCD